MEQVYPSLQSYSDLIVIDIPKTFIPSSKTNGISVFYIFKYCLNSFGMLIRISGESAITSLMQKNLP